MGSSIALVRAEVDREIARMARLGQIMDDRRALTQQLAVEARARLAAEKLSEESNKETPGHAHDILEEGSATESIWLANPDLTRYARAQAPPDEASFALQARAASPEPARSCADLDGWDAPQFPLPAWPSRSGLHSPSVPVRGAAVETDAAALAHGRRSGLGQYRVLRTCRVRRAAALSSEICGTLEPGRVIEVVARRTVTVPPKRRGKGVSRRGSWCNTSAGDAADQQEQTDHPSKVVRLRFCGGWVSECTASRGLRSLQKLCDSLSTTQPRRQHGVGRHTAERLEASFYSHGVHHSDGDTHLTLEPEHKVHHRKHSSKKSSGVYVRPGTPLSPSQARRLGMPMTPAYTLAQLQAGAWRSLGSARGGPVDPQRLEMSLSNDAFEAAFGMDKATFERLPSFERERRKKIVLLTATA